MDAPDILSSDHASPKPQVTWSSIASIDTNPAIPVPTPEITPARIPFTRFLESSPPNPLASNSLAPEATYSDLDIDSLPEISPATASRLVQIEEIRFGIRELVMAVAWSPDGNMLAVSAGNYVYWHDAKTLKELNRYHLGSLTHSIGFSPNNRWFAAGSRDGFVRVWDLGFNPIAGSAEPFLDISAHKKGVNSVAFSPDSSTLASGGNDAVARLWDAQTGELLGLTIGGSYTVPAITFTPDGLTLAVLNGKVIRMRQIGSERIVGTIQAENPLYSMAFSQDGKTLATGNLDNLVQLWDPEQVFRTGQEDYPESVLLEGHSGKGASYRSLIWKVVFSLDGSLLASTGGDAAIRLWDVVKREPVAILLGHVGGVTCVAFYSGARLLASGGLDGTIRIWGVR